MIWVDSATVKESTSEIQNFRTSLETLCTMALERIQHESSNVEIRVLSVSDGIFINAIKRHTRRSRSQSMSTKYHPA